MWGALTFLVLFLVIDPTTRHMILDVIEDARLRIAVEAPWPYFLIVIIALSASVSALIMRLWPRSEEKFRRVRVMHRYQGLSASEMARNPKPPALAQLVMETAGLLFPVRARVACGKLLRNLVGFTSRA